MNTVHDSIEDVALVLNKHREIILNSEIFKALSSTYDFTPQTITSMTRLPGASNIVYRISFQNEDKSYDLIYRRFVNKLVDLRIEQLIFQKLSDTKQGPYCFYQWNEYRIEEYIASRTITIFELRNPSMMHAIVTLFAKFHCNKDIQDGVMGILQEENKDLPKTCLESFMGTWWKQIHERLGDLKEKLVREDYKAILDQFIETYYYDGFKDYWGKLLPSTDDKIISHTDAQETNILVAKPVPFSSKNMNLVIIDYEYAGLVERTWDLANYYTETMLSNWEYEEYPWVELFEDNRMEVSELERLVEMYIDALKHEDPSIQVDQKEMLAQVKNMVIAINYYWGAWAMVSVELDEVNDDNLYFPAAKHRMRLIKIAEEYL